jgi:hypothetical protein
MESHNRATSASLMSTAAPSWTEAEDDADTTPIEPLLLTFLSRIEPGIARFCTCRVLRAEAPFAGGLKDTTISSPRRTFLAGEANDWKGANAPRVAQRSAKVLSTEHIEPHAGALRERTILIAMGEFCARPAALIKEKFAGRPFRLALKSAQASVFHSRFRR